MTQTKRCKRCKRELSLDKFNKRNRSADQLQSHCRDCQLLSSNKVADLGMNVRLRIVLESGGCQNSDCCSSPYGGRLVFTGSNYGLFELDHVDESKKLHKNETNIKWIATNENEFWSRVRQNIQVLCYQCHRLKSNSSNRAGNAVYQKRFGRKPPAQFIDPGYDLFNNVERVYISVDDDGEIWETPIYSRGFHEDGWFVQRDLDGFLISYLEMQDGEGKYFMYNKDGERIL